MIVIGGQKYQVKEVYDHTVTVPDCFVVSQNTIGGGHGEAKLYMGSKPVVNSFFGFGGSTHKAQCFVLKNDLKTYLQAVKTEYLNPSQTYRGAKLLPRLWQIRYDTVDNLPDIAFFSAIDLTQIAGPRGYINSSDIAYQIIREISLPLITYISVMKIADSLSELYYFRLFVDFDAVANLTNGPLVFRYGQVKAAPIAIPSGNQENRKETERKSARDGQGKYREQLLQECPFCPITKITDDRLLIASHIKPWAVSNDTEKVDPHNGYILSPLYDKLFDKGLMSFTDDRHILLSPWLIPSNRNRIGIKDHQFIQELKMDSKRQTYLDYHRKYVFKG